MVAFPYAYYRLNERLMFYIGQWPLQNPKQKFRFRALTVFLLSSILVPKIIKFVESFGDFSSMIRCLPVLGLHLITGTGFYNCTSNEEKLKRLTLRIKEDWLAQNDDEEIAILKIFAERGRLLTTVYSVYLFSSLWMYLLLPVGPKVMDIIFPLNESRNLIYLYETEYFVDQDEYYFWILLHAYITMPFAILMIIGFDTLLGVYVQHACGIFSVLCFRLENVGRNRHDLKEFKEVEQKDRDYEEIFICIQMHKKAIEFADLLESTVNRYFMVDFGTCAFMITLTGFMTVTNLDQIGEALRYVAFGICEVLHMFYLCWQGEKIMGYSEGIFLSAYNVDWTPMSYRSKKLLVMIMMRSSVSCKLTAGNLLILSLENFTSVLKTSVSYFTVLLSVQ